jgi:hydroxymethylpyrimidine pyrophosphatase-like HAD family hydrolase
MSELLTHEAAVLDFSTKKLVEARARGVGLMAFDYDGTLHDSKDENYGTEAVAQLMLDIARRGVIPAIITARGATALTGILPILLELSAAEQQSSSLYLATANGGALRRIAYGQVNTLYERRLPMSEIRLLLSHYSKLGLQITADEAQRMRSDAQKDWQDHIPPEYLQVALEHNGAWAEPTKMTFLFPRSAGPESWASLVLKMRESVGPDYMVAWGGQAVFDVTKALPGGIDGKKYTVDNLGIMHSVSPDRRVTFGDTPDGNDSAMLKNPLSIGFTNKDINQYPFEIGVLPYILPGTGNKVARVHDAVRNLLGE